MPRRGRFGILLAWLLSPILICASGLLGVVDQLPQCGVRPFYQVSRPLERDGRMPSSSGILMFPLCFSCHASTKQYRSRYAGALRTQHAYALIQILVMPYVLA